MDDTTTDRDTSETTAQNRETENSISRLSDRGRRIFRHISATALFLVIGTGTVVAQSGELGGGVCGTPLANTLNESAPLIIGILMVAGAIVTYIAHMYGGLVRDPNKMQEVKEYRNSAGFATITTPFVAWFILQLLTFANVELASCIDLVPFF